MGKNKSWFDGKIHSITTAGVKKKSFISGLKEAIQVIPSNMTSPTKKVCDIRQAIKLMGKDIIFQWVP